MRSCFFVAWGCLILSVCVEGAEPPADGQKRGGFSSIFDSILNRQPQATTTNQGTNAVALSNLSTNQINDGLKQALEMGFKAAVTKLGQTNGFLSNPKVHIPLPSQLKYVEQTLQALHQDELVDEFEASMNHAAEKAVPAATSVLLDAARQVSLRDATSLLASKSQTAVTDFFQKATSTNLFTKLLPLVQEATSKAGVTSGYKQLMEKVALGRFSFLSNNSMNIDHYVTQKTLDGLFATAAEEEQRIRENPQARTTELLQKVFGAIQTGSGTLGQTK